MIDATNLKAPGWQRIVQELAGGAPDDRAYLERLVAVLTQVSAARQGVVWVPAPAAESGETQMRPLLLHPAPVAGDGAGQTGSAGVQRSPIDENALLHGAEARRAAFAAMESAQSRIFSLSQAGDAALYDAGGGAGYVLALPLSAAAGSGGDGAPSAVATLLIEARGRSAVQSTLAMAEVLAGYVHAHAARQELRRVQHSGLALDTATRLLGAINSAANYKGACMQLVNQAARVLGADRAALGWVVGDKVRVEAISDTEHFDRRMAMVQKLGAAMEECLDQAQPVLHPPPAEGQDVVLSQAITHAHRELAAGEPGLKVCSAPLRAGDEVVGVLTIEHKGQGAIDPASVELLQSTLDLLTPVLKVRRNDDRILALRAKDSLLRAGAWAVGPKHTAWKLGVLALSAALAFCALYRTTYRVGALAHVQPAVKRIISAPFEATLARLADGVEPGAVVRAGQVLVDLDATEFALQASEAEARMNQALKAVGLAMKDGKTSEAQKAQAQADAARAQMDMYRSRVERARIVAPIDGVILSGNLRDKVGAAARTGDELFQIAPLESMEVVLKVDERDIGLVKEAVRRATETGEPARGAVALRSAPDKEFAFTVTSVVPMAVAADGHNTFEVRGRLADGAGWLRPGMEGYAKVETERASLLWIGTRRVVETVRLWLW